MSTNLDALPGGRSSADSSESQQEGQGQNSGNGGYASNASAQRGFQSRSQNGFSSSYPPSGGFNAPSGSGIVSAEQAKKAADTLGLPANAQGFPSASGANASSQNSLPRRQQGENSQPASSPSATSGNYYGGNSYGNNSQNRRTPPPYPPIKRKGTTVLPPIPSPPPPLILAPPFPTVTLHPPVPPEEVKAVKGAVSDTRPLANSLEGIRVEYAPLKDEMDQETIDAISRFGKHMANNPQIRLIMEGFSGAQDDDPSLPRRLALQRLLKIRALLMRAGVASTRIYPKTIGVPRPNTHETNGPPDRVDIYPEENPNEQIPQDDAIARAYAPQKKS